MTDRTPVVLGIDAGTTSVKSVLFSPDGGILALARYSVAVTREDGGVAESDMDEVWRATVHTIREALAEVPGADVVAIGVTGQGDGAWLLDADDRPVRSAALWMDGRAGDRVRGWFEDGRARAVHEATGSPLFAGALPVLLAELAETEPEIVGRAALHLNCKDWVRFRLTGEKATDPSEASRTYLDTQEIGYSDRLFAELGQEELRRLLPPVQDPYSVAGTLSDPAARELGLPAGIPVAVGLVDTVASAVGLGAVEAETGFIVLGTTGTVGVTHASRDGLKTDFGITLATGRGTQVIEAFSTMSGTPNLDWVRATLRLEDADWRTVERSAAAAPRGSGGVLYLPYGSPSGERAPFVDPDASASWHGMSVTTTPGELLRSVYEGLVHSLTESLDLLELRGPIAVCGGGSDSDLMCQILADVSGRPVRRGDAEVGARGAAIVALVASGQVPDLETAVERMSSGTTTFEPDPDAHAYYAAAHRVFLDIRDSARAQWEALRALRS
ncbi:FGGY-family carbohydrate kinase [Naasia sp. SYSU D00948]|uniref:FGGY-family carbohydrate kinase n=1 Tax=Naasia sp. SYSU D00948 TaxID=2817379 RepID=UPI001B31371A|nr:FGGY-family carbohydrate kinase [Naasia sp. SYSU D00948]